MRPHSLMISLAGLLGLFACRREAPPVEPDHASDPQPAAEPEPEPASSVASDALCQHMLEVMQADLGDLVELDAAALPECVAGIEDKRTTMPPEQFEREGSCVLAAATVEAIAACSAP